MQLSELEYKGLNLFDEVQTVEIAVDERLHVVHIFDTNDIVEPTYNYQKQNFELSDGFYSFVEVLKSKYFFVEKRELKISDWIESFTFQFYSSKRTLKTYSNKNLNSRNVMECIHFSDEELIGQKLYPKYVKRLAEGN